MWAAIAYTHHRHLVYHYSSRKLISHYHPKQGIGVWIDLGTVAVMVFSPCPRLYIAVIFATHKLTTVGFDPRISCTAVRNVTTRHCHTEVDTVSPEGTTDNWAPLFYNKRIKKIIFHRLYAMATNTTDAVSDDLLLNQLGIQSNSNIWSTWCVLRYFYTSVPLTQ